jgi:hypothetical protein
VENEPNQADPRRKRNVTHKALGDVVFEVLHQKEKWGPSHDFYHHQNGELLVAAKVMLAGRGRMPAADWRHPDDLARREQLIRAAAFIIAEVDRLDCVACGGLDGAKPDAAEGATQ